MMVVEMAAGMVEGAMVAVTAEAEMAKARAVVEREAAREVEEMAEGSAVAAREVAREVVC